MTDTPGEHLDEEPQEERGPGAPATPGPTSRAVARSTALRARSDEDADTSVDPEGAQDPDAPDLRPAG